MVGLVIGGIWIAAAAVNENIKWRRTEDGWLYYINYVSHTYTAKLMATLPGTVDLETRVVAAAGLPAGWSCCGTYGQPLDPYGNTLSIQASNASNWFIGYNSQTPSKSFCIKWMLMTFNKILGQGKMLEAVTYSFPGAPGVCSTNAAGSYNPPEGNFMLANYVASNCCPNGGLGFYARYKDY